MVFPTQNQIFMFLASAYGGLIIGIFYDLYRFVRNTFRFGRIATYIGDLIFWLITCFFMLAIIYRSSSGLIRVYQIMGFGIGMLIYKKALSGYMLKLLSILSSYLAGFFYIILKIFRGPFIIVYRIINMAVYQAGSKLSVPVKSKTINFIKRIRLLIRKK